MPNNRVASRAVPLTGHSRRATESKLPAASDKAKKSKLTQETNGVVESEKKTRAGKVSVFTRVDKTGGSVTKVKNTTSTSRNPRGHDLPSKTTTTHDAKSRSPHPTKLNRSKSIAGATQTGSSGTRKSLPAEIQPGSSGTRKSVTTKTKRKCGGILSELEEATLLDRNGKVIKIREDVKCIGFYFSAHWCGPCKRFTPILADFYKEVSGSKFEIIFISSDYSEDDQLSYMKESHGKWLALQLDSPLGRELNKKYKVSGIPTLVVVSVNGNIVTYDGVDDVKKYGKKAMSQWKLYM